MEWMTQASTSAQKSDAVFWFVFALSVAFLVFITALISFIMIAAVVYFMVIKPYQALKEAADARLKADTDAEAPAPTTDELLAEIRDLLKTRA